MSIGKGKAKIFTACPRCLQYTWFSLDFKNFNATCTYCGAMFAFTVKLNIPEKYMDWRAQEMIDLLKAEGYVKRKYGHYMFTDKGLKFLKKYRKHFMREWGYGDLEEIRKPYHYTCFFVVSSLRNPPPIMLRGFYIVVKKKANKEWIEAWLAKNKEEADHILSILLEEEEREKQKVHEE